MANPVSTIQSLRAVDAWIDIINANINGGVRTAFKTSRLQFAGGNPLLDRAATVAALPLQFPSPTLVASHTILDLSQGAIVASTEETHLAIQGQGYFLVTDGKKEYLTRDGEFHRDARGLLVNSQGLVLLDRSLAIGLDPTRYQLTLPPSTVAEVNGASTGWQPGRPGASTWFPYVPGTVDDEGGSYQLQTILGKRLFNFEGVTGTEQFTIRTDNAGWLIVNGHLLTLADVASGPYPAVWNVDTVLNVGPYLQEGINIIAFKASESTGGESFRISGAVGTYSFTTEGERWATTVVSHIYDVSPPTAAEMARLAASSLDDVLVVKGPTSGGDLAFSRYGATVWEWLRPPALIEVGLPGANGAGTVLRNALEASNASMTQSVPELSLAQKLFSALTKVIQIHQTNQDAVLNTIR